MPALEIEAIKEHKTFGVDGYNLTAGGEGTLGRTFTVSAETKIKISQSTKGREGKPLSDETKQKLRDANLGKKQSAETIAKKSAANKISQKGRVKTAEHRRKISESLSGRTLTDEQKKNLAEKRKGKVIGMSGKKHTAETKSKISKLKTGVKTQPCSEERKRKIGEAHKGKEISEEAREKMSRAAKLNRGSKNSSKFIGVSFHSMTGKWRATIMIKKVSKSLGLFFTEELAYAAYCNAKNNFLISSKE